MPSPVYFREAAEIEAGWVFWNHIPPGKSQQSPKDQILWQPLAEGFPLWPFQDLLVHLTGPTVARALNQPLRVLHLRPILNCSFSTNFSFMVHTESLQRLGLLSAQECIKQGYLRHSRLYILNTPRPLATLGTNNLINSSLNERALLCLSYKNSRCCSICCGLCPHSLVSALHHLVFSLQGNEQLPGLWPSWVTVIFPVRSWGK